MSRELTRRTMLQLLGGVTAGAVLSPLPWKILDDAAIWTQNWSWLPKVPRGSLGVKRSACTLCPAGCGVLARTVAGRPYQLAALKGHPSGGALCPLGLAAHHLPTHRLRLRHPVMLAHASPEARLQAVAPRQHAIDVDHAVDTLAGWVQQARTTGLATGNNHAVVVLEPRSDRVQSVLMRRFLGALGCGTHASCDPDEASMGVLRDMLVTRAGAPTSAVTTPAAGELQLGWDLDRTRTILSFGAPLFEGWIAPGRVASRLVGREALADGERPLLLQVETRPSRTALLADQWIPIAAGCEATLALGIGHVVVTEGRYDRAVAAAANDFSRMDGQDYAGLVLQFPPERVEQITGIPAEEVRQLARTFITRGPAVALAGADPGGGRLGADAERAIWALNLLAGSIGTAGGFVARRPLPLPSDTAADPLAPTTHLETVPDGSIHLLIVDGGVSGQVIPWRLLHRKLAASAHVVSLSPFADGLALRADLIVPAPAPFEALEEVPTPVHAPAASLALSAPLFPAEPQAITPTTLLARLCSTLALDCGIGDDSFEQSLAGRLRELHAAGRGRVTRGSDGAHVSMADVSSPDELRDLLMDGGCWVDDPCEPPAPLALQLLGRDTDGYQRLRQAGEGPGLTARPAQANGLASGEVLLMPFGWGAGSTIGALPPLLSKLCRESDLRAAAGQAWMNPATALACGLHDREAAVLRSNGHSASVTVRCDAAVLPGMVHVAVGPCDASFGDCQGAAKRSGRGSATRASEAILALCPPGEDCTWRLTKATAHRA